MNITERRQPFATRREQLARQRQWLIDIDRLLDPPEWPSNGAMVAEQLQRYLNNLVSEASHGSDEFDQQAAAHIQQVFHNRWWGLFACYNVPGLPRTNNELETFLRRLKTTQRRVTGRKNVHDFIVRYGRFVAFIDPSESQESLLARLRQVPYADFAQERTHLIDIEEQAAKRHRFRHKQSAYLQQMEDRWTAACAVAQETM